MYLKPCVYIIYMEQCVPLKASFSLQEFSLGIYRPWHPLQLLDPAMTFHTSLFNLSATTFTDVLHGIRNYLYLICVS